MQKPKSYTNLLSALNINCLTSRHVPKLKRVMKTAQKMQLTFDHNGDNYTVYNVKMNF